VNTFKFNVSTSDAGAHASIRTHLQLFYSAIQEHWSVNVNPPAVRLKMYEHDAPTPRAPIYDELLGLTGGTSVDELPSEIAVCISFQGLRLSGVPQARRRGRIYFGPLKATANANGRLYFLIADDIKDAVQNMAQACDDETGLDWVVVSGVPGTTPRFCPVHDGWVDNAFDVQRRRGLTASLRNTWAIT
jgi:hypothetical protein